MEVAESAEPRVVDQQLDLNSLPGRERVNLPSRPRLRQVGLKHLHVYPMFRAEVRGERRKPLDAPGCQNQVTAGGCELLGDGFADAGAGTRYQSPLPRPSSCTS